MQRYVFPATFAIVNVIFPVTFNYFNAFFPAKLYDLHLHWKMTLWIEKNDVDELYVDPEKYSKHKKSQATIIIWEIICNDREATGSCLLLLCIHT